MLVRLACGAREMRRRVCVRKVPYALGVGLTLRLVAVLISFLLVNTVVQAIVTLFLSVIRYKRLEIPVLAQGQSIVSTFTPE
jgi:hypothetical protein